MSVSPTGPASPRSAGRGAGPPAVRVALAPSPLLPLPMFRGARFELNATRTGDHRCPTIRTTTPGPCWKGYRRRVFFQRCLTANQSPLVTRKKRLQNGFSISTPVGSKSATLRVTTIAPRIKAVAAICKSAPLCPILAESCPQTRDSSSPNGKRRSANCVEMPSNHLANCLANSGLRLS